MSVKITKDQHGFKVITSKNNPEFGYIRVEETRIKFDGKFTRNEKRSALINGPIELLQQVVAEAVDDTLPGKIVIKESLTPFTDDPQKSLKIAGKTGIPCTRNDQPIFRDTFYTEDLSEKDVFEPHDNGDQIKAAQKQVEAEVEGALS